MSNSIPLSGASSGAGGALLPSPLVDSVVEGVQRESGTLALVDIQTTNSRKETIPVYKGRPQAAFVNEGSSKPVDGAEFGSLTLNVKKSAIIIPFTDELLADAQEDARVLVTADVEKAFADLWDQHILGLTAGTALTTAFDSDLAGDAGASSKTQPVNDYLAKAVSAAMGTLEGNGYTPNGVLLGPDSRQVIRDGRSALDSTLPLAGDPLYGLPSAMSTNLSPVSGATKGKVLGIVADWSHARCRVRSDIELTVSNQAAYTQGGSLVSAFEKNTTLLRWEARLGFIITDPRAVVKIIKGGPSGS
jgi:HK97 family phage major capsid protein